MMIEYSENMYQLKLQQNLAKPLEIDTWGKTQVENFLKSVTVFEND